MRRNILAALIVAAGALCAAPSAVAQPETQLADIQIQSLAVRVDETDSEFELIDARMDETATAAVFFGIIGATVNSAANNAEDDEKAAPFVETAAGIDLDTLIAEALRERLASRESVALAETPESASHTLVLEIGEWGLIRRAQRPDLHMRAFLKMNISIEDARGRTVWGPTREHAVGQTAVELPEYTPDLFKTEIEALAARSGRQVANRLIYR